MAARRSDAIGGNMLTCGGNDLEDYNGAQLAWAHQCRFLLHLVGVHESGPPIFSLFRLCRSFIA